MAYANLILLDTSQSAESVPVVIARLRRLLVVTTISGAASVKIMARLAGGSWRELASLTESGEFSLDNYGWEAMCVRVETSDATSHSLVSLSWSEP